MNVSGQMFVHGSESSEVLTWSCSSQEALGCWGTARLAQQSYRGAHFSPPPNLCLYIAYRMSVYIYMYIYMCVCLCIAYRSYSEASFKRNRTDLAPYHFQGCIHHIIIEMNTIFYVILRKVHTKILFSSRKMRIDIPCIFQLWIT